MRKQKSISKSISYSRKIPKSDTFSLLSSPRIFTIIALIFIILILVPLAKNYSRKRLIEKEVADISQSIEEFESTSQELKELANYLDSEQSLVEQARLNMGMKKPGESVVVVQGDLSKLIKPVSEEKVDIPNRKKWLKYFLN